MTPQSMDDVARRAHRRRTFQAVAVGSSAIVVIAGAVAIWVARPATGPAVVAPPVPVPATSSIAATFPATVTTSAQLPAGYWFDTLFATDNLLQLRGTTASAPSSACAVADIKPASLVIEQSTIATGGCASTSIDGEIVNPVITYDATYSTGHIAMAVTDEQTGASTTGPIIMTFERASDTNAVITYGGSSVWLYDVASTNGPEAIEVSATSGKVLQSVRTPKLDEPVLAANADGLWLGNSIRGGTVAGTLFHIAPGSHSVTTVVPDSDKAVDWILAGDGHVWAGIRSNYGVDEDLWRFDGVAATVALHVPEPGVLASDVVGSESEGLWTALPTPPFGATISRSANKELDVVRIDPDTGARTVEAALPALPTIAAEGGIAPGSAAFLDGSYYLLEPPFQQGGYEGYSTLAKITPAG